MSDFSVALVIALIIAGIIGVGMFDAKEQNDKIDQIVVKMKRFSVAACSCKTPECGMKSLKSVAKFLGDVGEERGLNRQVDNFTRYYESWESCIEKSGVPLSLFKTNH